MHLAYDVIGDGSPIIFVHGAFSQRRVFGYQLLALAREHSVVAIDLPGHGGSSWDPNRPWFAQAVDAVVAVWRELGLNKPTIVGWSIGANVARAAATEIADARLVLVGAPTRPLDETQRDGVARFMSADYPRYVASIVRSFTFATTSAEAEDWLLQMALTIPIEVSAAAVLDDPGPLPTLPSDTLVVHGAHDQVVPPQDRLQCDHEHIFELSGHLPFIEERKRFNALIAETAGA